MVQINKNTYAFDECSILHLCEVKIPNAFITFFEKDKLAHKCYTKLKTFIGRLDSNEITKYRFEPSNIDDNIIKVADELLATQGNQVIILGNVLKTQIIDQLQEFNENIINSFEVISKNENIDSIKKIFIKNEIELKKEKNIPEDDDLKIIAGYSDFYSNGKKHLISEDEHFLGYSKLIEDEFKIVVVNEWECHKIQI